MRKVALLAATAISLTLPAFAQTSPGRPGANDAMSAANRAEAQAVIEQILTTRPDVIADAVARDRENNRRERAGIVFQALRLVQMEGEVPTNPSSIGPVTGRSLIVWEAMECSRCRDLHDELRRRAETEGWRVTFKTLPAARENGVLPLKALWAAGQMGRWSAMHTALHGISGEITEGAIQAAATRLGLNRDELNRNMNSPAAELAVARDIQSAFLAGLRQTPTLVVDGRQAIEAPSVDDLRRVLDAVMAEARADQEAQTTSPSPAQPPRAQPEPQPQRPAQPAPTQRR